MSLNNFIENSRVAVYFNLIKLVISGLFTSFVPRFYFPKILLLNKENRRYNFNLHEILFQKFFFCCFLPPDLLLLVTAHTMSR